LLQQLHSFVDADAAGLLARREFLECGEELANDRLRRHTYEHMVDHPVVICIRGDVGPFVGVHAQIEDLGYAQRDERLGPKRQRALGPLFCKNNLPVVVAQADQFGGVVEVKELLAGIFLCLAG
jgi:hypothetical protein